MKSLLLIDAHSLVHRCYHALPPLTGAGGRPAQAIYGLASMLLKLWNEDPPAYAAALFDRPEPTFRKKEYPAYKATRPKAPDELVSQLIESRELFRAFGVASFEEAGIEADDLIAAVADRFKDDNDLRVVVLTGDKDALQLVSGDRVVVRALRRGISDTATYDESAVRAEYGLPPDKLPDYKAFVGDASDNIAGVPGVGPKTASVLLRKYGSLEGVFAHLGDEEKLAPRLAPHRAQAEQAKRLTMLKRDVPLALGRVDDLAFHPDPEAVKRYFASFGFASLIRRMEKNGGAPRVKGGGTGRKAHARTNTKPHAQGAMF